MDALLGNYGSDEEEEIPQQEEQKTKVLSQVPSSSLSHKVNKESSLTSITPKSTTTGTLQVAHVPGQKKRKLLDISILPDHIQKALIHGASALGDSDDDDHNPNTISHKTSASFGANNARSKTAAPDASDPLLAMLPAPSHNKEDTMDALFASSSAHPATYPKPSSVAKSTVKPLIKRSEEVEEEDETEEVLLGGSIGISQRGFQPPLLTRQYTSDPDSIDPSASLSHQFSQDHHSTYESRIDPPEYSVDHQRHGDSQRKRQRNLEQMLMSGNLTALEQGASVQEIQVGNQWDASGYSEQKQREAAIYNQYTAGGTVKAALQPTRQQNRKHQLTSLAMKAAETEIAMLDAHIARSKTKSQTQSRYGW